MIAKTRDLLLFRRKLYPWLIIASGFILLARPPALQDPAIAADGPVRFTVGFDQERYEISPGQTFSVRVLISPAPATGLFSFGVRLLVSETNGSVAQASAIQPATGLNFNGVLGSPALKQILPGSAAVKGTVDFFAVPLVPSSNALLATFQVRDVGSASYTLRLDFFNTLGPTEQIFVDGKGNVLDPQITFDQASVVHVAGSGQPVLEILSPITLNRQTGLFEQIVRVRNTGSAVLSAVRVRFPDLPAGVRIYNATGSEAEGPYLQYNQPLAAGASVDLTIEYYIRDRQPIAQPTLDAVAVDPATPPVADGKVLRVSRSVRLKDGSFLVEFSSEAHRIYSIQYSTDTVTWRTAVPSIRGTGTQVQWIDNGPPKTEKHPNLEPKRFYRVVRKP